jgi:hypothetical protein
VELSRTMDEGYRMDDKGEEDVMGLLFAASTSDEDFVPRPDWASLKARAARLLRAVLLTRRRALTLLLV